MEIKKTITALTISFITFCPAFAQQSDVMKQINDIKMKAKAEGILTDQMMTEHPEVAFDECAHGILRQLGGGYTLSDIKPHLHHLLRNCGSKSLVFVYLKKNDLGSPTISTPVNNTVKVQAKFDVDAQGHIIHHDEKKEDTVPHHQAPIVKDTCVSKPTNSFASQMCLDVMAKPDVNSVMTYLKGLKQTGRIANFGLYLTSTDIDNQYVILFSTQSPFAPIGILEPVSNGQRINMLTRSFDSISAHAGCGAVWVSILKP